MLAAGRPLFLKSRSIVPRGGAESVLSRPSSSKAALYSVHRAVLPRLRPAASGRLSRAHLLAGRQVSRRQPGSAAGPAQCGCGPAPASSPPRPRSGPAGFGLSGSPRASCDSSLLLHLAVSHLALALSIDGASSDTCQAPGSPGRLAPPLRVRPVSFRAAWLVVQPLRPFSQDVSWRQSCTSARSGAVPGAKQMLL